MKIINYGWNILRFCVSGSNYTITILSIAGRFVIIRDMKLINSYIYIVEPDNFVNLNTSSCSDIPGGSMVKNWRKFTAKAEAGSARKDQKKNELKLFLFKNCN